MLELKIFGVYFEFHLQTLPMILMLNMETLFLKHQLIYLVLLDQNKKPGAKIKIKIGAKIKTKIVKTNKKINKVPAIAFKKSFVWSKLLDF